MGMERHRPWRIDSCSSVPSLDGTRYADFLDQIPQDSPGPAVLTSSRLRPDLVDSLPSPAEMADVTKSVRRDRQALEFGCRSTLCRNHLASYDL